MHSCLYEGWVRHKRSSPVDHGFRYRMSLLYLDLSELDALPGGRLSPARRYSPLRFRREDHLGPPQQDLAESVREVISAAGQDPPGGAIRILTQPRYFGYVFNPVSFYFCYDSSQALQTVVAEVHNTPWRERHCYVLPASRRQHLADAPPLMEKQFHVSPFMPMAMQYRWRLSRPGETLSLGIENQERSKRVFSAALRLQRRPLTTTNLVRALVRFPFQAQRVSLAIYWQAFLLWSKGCPYYPHPASSPPAASLPAQSVR